MDEPKEKAENERYGKKLAIIVPYRNRAGHLARFLPHILAYFERDKLDRQIPISIHIIEQRGRAPFNSGKVKNCGFLLTRDQADYFCFHDIDYLPIWADYSWSPKPARLIRYGLRMRENWEKFFGAVVLFDKTAFEKVNGYPNVYWGWGAEDEELGIRCVLTGLGFDRRDGTFRALQHKHAGYSAPGVYTDEARRTLALFNTRRPHILEEMRNDGLNTMTFETVKRLPIILDGVQLQNAFHYVVDIGTPEAA